MNRTFKLLLGSILAAGLFTGSQPILANEDEPAFYTTFEEETSLEEYLDTDSLVVPFKIIGGTDERKPVKNVLDYPYSAICKLLIEFEKDGARKYDIGTGFLISENQVLTAGHCLYNSDYGDAVSVQVTPAAGADKQKFGTFTVTGENLIVNPEYRQNTSTDNDYGLIVLNSNVGAQTKYFQLGTVNPNAIDFSQTLELSGYPYNSGDNIDTLLQQSGKGNLVSRMPGKVRTAMHAIDASPGQSGSPIFNDKGEVIAIHTFAYRRDDTNGGVLIDETVKEFIAKNTPTAEVKDAVYRVYNPNSGEHFYTANYTEMTHLSRLGWNDEGIAWMTESKDNGIPLFRVFNPNDGLHHYTKEENEKEHLISLGWRDEGIAWYASQLESDPSVYRVYNPNSGQHHFTMNKNEKDYLVSVGWNDEGISFNTKEVPVAKN